MQMKLRIPNTHLIALLCLTGYCDMVIMKLEYNNATDKGLISKNTQTAHIA